MLKLLISLLINIKKNSYRNLLCLFLWASPAAFAVPGLNLKEEKAPIKIQSDSADFDEKLGLITHRGNVSVIQGGRQLTADTLFIYRNKAGKISQLTAIGKPASFRVMPDANKSKILGKANTLNYFLEENKIELIDAAELTQNNKTIQGASMSYDLTAKRLVSNSNENQRTTLIIDPKDLK